MKWGGTWGWWLVENSRQKKEALQRPGVGRARKRRVWGVACEEGERGELKI